jgi:hypothetical protein
MMFSFQLIQNREEIAEIFNLCKVMILAESFEKAQIKGF